MIQLCLASPIEQSIASGFRLFNLRRRQEEAQSMSKCRVIGTDRHHRIVGCVHRNIRQKKDHPTTTPCERQRIKASRRYREQVFLGTATFAACRDIVTYPLKLVLEHYSECIYSR